MSAPRVTVVIPNWNGARLLPACLAALAEQGYRDFETIVVDNGSSDGSLELLEAHFPEVRVLALEVNTGFTGAVNRGIAASRSELVALLNNDLVVSRDWLGALIGAADRHPRAGSFASRILRADDPSLIYAAGDRLGRSGRAVGIGRDRPDGPEFAVERAVFGASGAATLYRRVLLDEVGCFDDDFFAYVEDTDLAFRAQALGWGCIYVPEAQGCHVGSASLAGNEDRRSLLCLRNHLFFLTKNYPPRLLLHNLGAVVGGLGREIRFAFGAVRCRRGGLRALGAVAGVLASVLWRAPRMLGKRFRLARIRRASPRALAALFE